jgi:hypothetical protein
MTRALRFLFVLAIGALGWPAMAQLSLDNPLPQPEPFLRDSGVLSNPVPEARILHVERIALNDPAWQRLYFGEIELGPGSFLRITSEADGEVQVLDAEALEMWSNSSAYFNGVVTVELVGGPQTPRNRLVIEKRAFETEATAPTGTGCGICGPDDRVPSGETWSARLLPAGCSASIYNTDSCAVSAGHCVGGGMVMQFNVPPSTAGCGILNPPIAEQFPVIQFQFSNGGVGNDWAAMRVGTNNLGQTPFQRYGQSRPIATTPPQTNQSLTIWGYGVDDQCTESQTQQTSSGNVTSVSTTFFNHNVDATFGNSGSGILRNGAEILGIATHCPCPNFATRVDHPSFEAAREALCPTAVPQAATLTTVNVVTGGSVSGGLAELQASDNTYLSVAAVTQGPRNNTVTEVMAQSPLTSVSDLELTVEVGASNGNPVFQTISLFNYDTSSYDILSFSIVSTTQDTVEVFDSVSNPNAYVSLSGQIAVRVTQTARVAQTPSGFLKRVDHVKIFVVP